MTDPALAAAAARRATAARASLAAELLQLHDATRNPIDRARLATRLGSLVGSAGAHDVAISRARELVAPVAAPVAPAAPAFVRIPATTAGQ